jgi:signal transduction histidine kinase
MDGGWVLAGRVIWQLVAWPLAALLLVRLARRRPRPAVLPVIAVAALLVSLALLLLVAPAEGSTWFTVLTAPWFITFAVLCSTYPDGRFVPRWFVWPTAAYTIVTLLDVALGGALREQSWWGPFAMSQLLMLGGQVYRYRLRATTAQRESVRWAVLGVLVEVELFILVMLVEGGTVGEGMSATRLLSDLAALPIPVAFAIGLLWPRLVSVDATLRAILAVTIAGTLLAAMYATTTTAAVAAGVGGVATGWWGAAVVAVLAAPAARVAARAATWVVYRGRSDPAEAVARLGAAFDAQPDTTTVPTVVLETVVASAFLDGAALHGDGVLSASVGDVGPVNEKFPVVYQGEEIATLAVPPRRGESELTRDDREVIARLVVHAAPALHGVRALADLTEAHARLLHAREEERKGLRRDLHDDLGPTLAGLALGAAAVSRRAAAVDADVAAMAEDLLGDIQAAVTQTREIAYGLRPAVLDDHGLVAAIRSRVLGQEADRLQVEVRAPSARLTLPAAVDLAALRIVQEGVTNVRRHAGASRCTVTLAMNDSWLSVSVDDNGVGPPARLRPGIGLTSIRERATELGGTARFTRAPGGGGLLAVSLPVREPAT